MHGEKRGFLISLPLTPANLFSREPHVVRSSIVGKCLNILFVVGKLLFVDMFVLDGRQCRHAGAVNTVAMFQYSKVQRATQERRLQRGDPLDLRACVCEMLCHGWVGEREKKRQCNYNGQRLL